MDCIAKIQRLNEIKDYVENDDEVESLFQKIFIDEDSEQNHIYKNNFLLQSKAQIKPQKSNFVEENSELKEYVCSTSKNITENENEVLVLATPKKQKKFKERNPEQLNENNVGKEIEFEKSFENIEDEVETAKRYLRIHTAPLYRWSVDMIPNNIIKSQRSATAIGERPLNEYQQQPTSHNKSFLFPSLQENGSKLEDEDENNSFFNNYDRSSIPIIINNNNVRNYNIKSTYILGRIKHLIKAYSERGAFVKKVFEKMNENESRSDNDDDENDSEIDNQEQRKHDSISFETLFGDEWKHEDVGQMEKRLFSWNFLKNLTYEPQNHWYISWLMLVSFTFFYNAIFIPYRLIFPYDEKYTSKFILMDVLSDLTYLIDIFWFKPRLRFIENGHSIDSVRETHRHYFLSFSFLLDLLAQLPFDWFFIHERFGTLLLRLNRLIKIPSFWEFFERIDKVTNNPYLFRIIHTLLYELYIIHLGACLYYRVSQSIGFGKTPWSYNNQGNAYLRCFYFAFRTTTSIGGRLPKPSTEFERIYMMITWLLGVFVFAMVIGQIRDIVAHASRNQNYYIDALNKICAHMNRLNVPKKLQKRVRFWYKLTWDLQKTFNEMENIRMLPLKMRTDLVLSIHSKTLSRVDLFQNINRSVLRDLILKLQPILFLPGDYVCRKGDVGHEMYIVNKGIIQVIDSDTRKVLATLKEGSVFGEIAILNLHGQTKRTADVRSCGYSQLFALKKQDLWETLRYYPEYQNILKRKVQRILRRKKRQAMKETKTVNIDQQNDQLENKISSSNISVTDQIQVESIVKDRPRTPRLFQTVMEVIEPESTLKKYFPKYRSQSLRISAQRPINKITIANYGKQRIDGKVRTSKTICDSIRLTKTYGMLNILTIGMAQEKLILITKDLYVYNVPITRLDERNNRLDLRGQIPVPLNIKYAKLFNDPNFQMFYNDNRFHSSFVLTILNQVKFCFITMRLDESFSYDVLNGNITKDFDISITISEDFDEFYLSNPGVWENFKWRSYKIGISSIGISRPQNKTPNDVKDYLHIVNNSMIFQFLCYKQLEGLVYLFPDPMGKCIHPFRTNMEIGFFTRKYIYLLNQVMVYKFSKNVLYNYSDATRLERVNLDTFFICPYEDNRELIEEQAPDSNKRRSDLMFRRQKDKDNKTKIGSERSTIRSTTEKYKSLMSTNKLQSVKTIKRSIKRKSKTKTKTKTKTKIPTKQIKSDKMKQKLK